MPSRALPALLALAAGVSAQVPFQHFIVSVQGPGFGSSAWFVAPATGDVTPVNGLVSPLTELTVITSEPLTGTLYMTGPLAAMGTPTLFNAPMTGRDAAAASPVTWFGPPGSFADAQFGPGGNLFMIVGGNAPGAGLWTGALFGGFAAPLAMVAEGVQVAADGNAAYVLTQRPGFPSTIWRYDAVTGAFAQVVSGLPEARAFDLFPAGSRRLLVGTRSGDLYTADAATGQVALFRSVGQGPIAALRQSLAGDVLFATDAGLLFTLASLPNALAALTRAPTDIEVGTFDSASFFTFGNGCPGSGSHVPAIGSTGLPTLGNGQFALTVGSAPGGTVAILGLGNSRRDWNGIPLPFDLTPIGAPGCAIAASGLILVVSTLSGSGPGNGTGSVPLPIPNQSALVGARLMSQWWVLDPQANMLGFTVSDGGEAVIR